MLFPTLGGQLGPPVRSEKTPSPFHHSGDAGCAWHPDTLTVSHPNEANRLPDMVNLNLVTMGCPTGATQNPLMCGSET